MLFRSPFYLLYFNETRFQVGHYQSIRPNQVNAESTRLSEIENMSQDLFREETDSFGLHSNSKKRRQESTEIRRISKKAEKLPMLTLQILFMRKEDIKNKFILLEKLKGVDLLWWGFTVVGIY